MIPTEKGVFGEHSDAFPNEADRLFAKDVAYEYGVVLDSAAPLGFGDSAATIVFENKIPNNCLPILWKETREWKPLFRRT